MIWGSKDILLKIPYNHKFVPWKLHINEDFIIKNWYYISSSKQGKHLCLRSCCLSSQTKWRWQAAPENPKRWWHEFFHTLKSFMWDFQCTNCFLRGDFAPQIILYYQNKKICILFYQITRKSYQIAHNYWYVVDEIVCRSYLKSVVHAIVIAFFVHKRV